MKASFSVQKKVRQYCLILFWLGLFLVRSEGGKAKGSIFEMWMWFMKR